MRIVTAAEAVSGIASRQQIYLQCAAATPSVLLDALVARAPELDDVSVVHLHCEGPGPAPGAEMAPHFRHRALFIGPNARAAIAEGRADYVPTFLSDVPRLFDCRSAPARRGLRQCDAARRPRLLFTGHVGRGDALGDPRRAAGHRPVQHRDAADARRQLHPRVADRPRGRMRRPAVRGPASGRSATSNDGSASTSPSSSPTAPRSSSGSAPSRRPPRSPCATSVTSASTPRCSPTRSSTSSRPASSPARARSATGARS